MLATEGCRPGRTKLSDGSEEEVLVFKIEGTQYRLVGWPAVHRWLEKEEAAWDWLRSGEFDRDPGSTIDRMNAQLARMQAAIEQSKTAGGNPAELQKTMRDLYGGNPDGLLHYESLTGAKVIDVMKAAGPVAGLAAYAFAKGQITPANAITIDELKGILLLTIPTFAPVETVASRLANERHNVRALSREISREVELGEQQRQAEWANLLGTAEQKAIGWAKRRVRRWRALVNQWRANEGAAIEDIRRVEKAYLEGMALKAPVEYWKNKAKEHKDSERIARNWLYVYFPIAALIIVVSFSGSAAYLLSFKTSVIPSGLYFIVSAGLASLGGLAFWVGRLLTKLYLSEHHLRHDAEERAVMTKTYLALTHNQVISEDDRQIILTALFRSTPDGIVKDDGGLDVSLPALLSRLGGRSA